MLGFGTQPASFHTLAGFRRHDSHGWSGFGFFEYSSLKLNIGLLLLIMLSENLTFVVFSLMTESSEFINSVFFFRFGLRGNGYTRLRYSAR